MATITKDTQVKPSDAAIDLTVTLENLMDIRVAAGSFMAEATARSLGADDVHTATADATYETDVIGYLCWNSNLSQVEILVDEVVLSAGHVYFSFADDPDRHLLHRLYEIRVPPGATDITGEDLIVYRIVPLVDSLGDPGRS